MLHFRCLWVVSISNTATFLYSIITCLIKKQRPKGVKWINISQKSNYLKRNLKDENRFVRFVNLICFKQKTTKKGGGPLSPHMGFAFGWTLGFFHRGCQLPRERHMHVGHFESEGLFILLFPPFFLLLFVPLFFLALWLTLMTEKITLICVSPVYYSPGWVAKTRPNRYGAVSYWLINFSLCAHTSLSVSLCVFVCLACVPDPWTNKTLCEKGSDFTKKDLEQMFHWPQSHFLSPVFDFFFPFLFFIDLCCFCGSLLVWPTAQTRECNPGRWHCRDKSGDSLCCWLGLYFICLSLPAICAVCLSPILPLAVYLSISYQQTVRKITLRQGHLQILQCHPSQTFEVSICGHIYKRHRHRGLLFYLTCVISFWGSVRSKWVYVWEFTLCVCILPKVEKNINNRG